MSEDRVYLYPVIIRLWHFINAALCLILIVTGISMQFSNPKYPLVRFDIAVSIHNIAAILLVFNYFIFIVGNIVSGNGKYYKFRIKGYIKDLMSQISYYMNGIFKNAPAPFPVNINRKFNPLQQFTYNMVLFLCIPALIITGIALMYPDIFIPLRFLGFSALHLTDLVHITFGFCVTIFMFIHVYFCTIGKTPLSNFKSMINGYHEAH